MCLGVGYQNFGQLSRYAHRSFAANKARGRGEILIAVGRRANPAMRWKFAVSWQTLLEIYACNLHAVPIDALLKAVAVEIESVKVIEYSLGSIG